jgi:SWI/SNF-related matrix-associated actin-dependent regulator of chromatin subfamily A containing DEAD/H box 1
MSESQAKSYRDLVNVYKNKREILLQDKALLKEAKKSNEVTLFDAKMNGASSTTDSSSNHILMELRKAANHPLLRRTLYDDKKVKTMAEYVKREQSGDTILQYVIEDMNALSDFELHKTCPLYRSLKGYELKEKDILNSGKFTVLGSLLDEKKEKGDRVLIFSQFVIMLDVLEDYLKIKGFKYYRLDGSTAVNERQYLIDSFNNNSDIFIFMLTTRAGGVGINLTAANVVIMHDIDYNPFNDKQAEDRCHRVGQNKEVEVYKLISKNSIDEAMLAIQKKKVELGADLNNETDGKFF